MVICSPAKRARKTVLQVCSELNSGTDEIQWIPEIYDASLNALLKILKSCSDHATTVLLVGHNPGLETLLEYLCRDRIPLAADGKLLAAACIANLKITTKWSAASQSSAKLVSITRPAEMK